MGNSRPQSNENDIFLFPKECCFKINISNLVSGEVETEKFKNFGGL